MNVIYYTTLGSFLTLGIYFSRNEHEEYNSVPQERKISLIPERIPVQNSLYEEKLSNLLLKDLPKH